ncbi:hypothetical protein E5D57_008484 [Metarhizium anisopliae]|nr:hypothetical protein E5D57_008484 [Metarhizium anisopliae]
MPGGDRNGFLLPTITMFCTQEGQIKCQTKSTSFAFHCEIRLYLGFDTNTVDTVASQYQKTSIDAQI